MPPWSLGVLTAAALPLRRVWPGPVFAWTVLVAAVLAEWPIRGALYPVALAISLYTVAALTRRAEALAAAVLAAAVVLAGGRPGGWHVRWLPAIYEIAAIAAVLCWACTWAPAGPTWPRCATARSGWNANATRTARWPRPWSGPASPARCTTAWPITSP